MVTGDLNRNFTFQKPIPITSGAATTWTTVFTCMGAYWPLNGQERIAAMASGSAITGKTGIRYIPLSVIKTTWQVLVGGSGEYLNIAGAPINIGGRNEWLEIQVRSVA